MKPTLLRDWKNQDPTGWIMSEKLDGWRMMWDGSNFLSRSGRILDVPEWFKSGMPDTPLDGELFAGRREFNYIQAMIRDGWHGLTFQVFDAPAESGSFAERLAHLETITLPSHAAKISQVICEGVEHMKAEAKRIVLAGGEGVVVRDPSAPYIPGRTSTVQRLVPIPPQANRRYEMSTL